MAIEGRTYRPVIDHKKCSACSVCFHACPAETMVEMRRETGTLRGKVYSDTDTDIRINLDKVPGSPPCQLNCPLDQDVRGYIKLISEKKYSEALELVRKTNPLPSVCGYVCHHPCEAACIRGSFDEPLSIKLLKRFLADYNAENPRPPGTVKTNGKKVAIVGAGPAGLTAAHELAGCGYNVEILESYPEPGGMLACAIPVFRLPREILKRDIEYIERMGVTIKTGICLGTDLSISDLQRGGAYAVIIAVGTHQGIKMNVKNEKDLEGYMDCLEFLARYAKDEKIPLGDEVLVVGGGNAAIDTARSAIRMDTKKVTIIYRRGPEEMPADRNEVKEALIEGVVIKFLTAPTKMIALNGRVSGLECVKTGLVESSGSGRRRPVNIADSEFIINADTIISAVGQEPDKELRKALGVNCEPMSTRMDGVFCAGDFVNGPTTVVEAMASGKRAARAVDGYLSKKN